MDAVATRDERTLRAQLAQARDVRDGLVRDLHAVDVELEALAPERKPYRLLELACGALEDLDELGAAKLFWGERDAEGPSRIRLARGRLDLFHKRLAEIEDRREAVAGELDQRQAKVELLEDELDELERQEELRKLEWVIERPESELPARALVMPWSRGGEDDRRFRRSLAASLALCLLSMLLIPLIPLPFHALDDEPVEIPERLTRLLMEARPLPPPPPREAEPPQQLAEQPAEEAPQQAAKAEGPGRGSREGTGEGPAEGPGKGILAFREKFSQFEQTQNLARLGSQARVRSPAAASGRTERAMVTTRAAGSSGGIDLAALSRGVGGGGGAGSGGAELAGVRIARATSTIAGGGGGGSGRGSGSAGGPPIGRTDEEIQIVFDRHKSALYRLYNRELRNDPALKGQMVLRIRIEPDGSVSLCELRATDMEAPELVAQVLARVRSFDFGAKDVPAVTILYPIDFLPAT